jgi:hypothetical protein
MCFTHSLVPDISKAKGAANDAINLFDSIPEIDAESPEGRIWKSAPVTFGSKVTTRTSFFSLGSAD